MKLNLKFCCAVVTYYPTEKELSIINKMAFCFDKLFIFDNTDTENNNVFLATCNNSKIEYLNYKHTNMGLSFAYNFVCNQALESDFDFICLLDQDSIFDNNEITKMKQYICNNFRKDIGIFAPMVFYQGEKVKASNIPEKEISWAISSGSFLSLKAYLDSPGFDSFYFIDKVDYAYCMELKKTGYKTICVNNVILKQQLGEYKKCFGLKVYCHSTIRHYYIFRNRIYYYLISNKPTLLNFLKVVYGTIKHIILISFAENNKLAKISTLFKAIKNIKDYILEKP